MASAHVRQNQNLPTLPYELIMEIVKFRVMADLQSKDVFSMGNSLRLATVCTATLDTVYETAHKCGVNAAHCCNALNLELKECLQGSEKQYESIQSRDRAARKMRVQIRNVRRGHWAAHKVSRNTLTLKRLLARIAKAKNKNVRKGEKRVKRWERCACNN